MPIRFRCQYCNQLLGIARRKAGMQVECPTCHGHVTVPETDAAAAAAAAAAAPAAAPAAAGTGPAAPLFERSDFPDFLNPPAEVPAFPDVASPPPPPAVPDNPPAYDVDRLPPAALSPSQGTRPATGIFLSPAQATALTIVAVFLLAVAFGAGLLVGRYCL
jgi:phage FluMu protein Com